MPDKKVMSLGFAVFNGHVNDADKKARAIMRDLYPDKLVRVEELEKVGNGIMYIFNVPKEPATAMYSTMVVALVNADRVELCTSPENEVTEDTTIPGARAIRV